MATPREMLDQIVGIFKNLPPVQRIAIGVALVALLVTMSVLSFRGEQKNFEVLFNGLAQEDAAEITTWLKAQRIPYELGTNGTSVLVPSDRVLQTRLDLAGEGLPRGGGGVGFEIFDKTTMGTTDFVYRINQMRAMQGELARTIRGFEQVSEARVHIAAPKESIFVEEQTPPTASISVKLRGRAKLSDHQVKAIVNLVASAIPGLTTQNITVVDTAGRLLFRGEGEKEGFLTASQMEYQQKMEERFQKKVETILEEVVGAGHAQARVTAEIDFSRASLTQENFDPEGQVTRSEQMLTEDDSKASGTPQGIPGVKGQLATFTEEGGAGGGADTHKRNNVTRNFEISKTTRQVQEAPGMIKRLSVAVMVDGTYDRNVDKDGNETLQYKPRTAEELQRFDKIVKNAIGFSDDRGDQVEVAGMPFALSSVVEKKPTTMEILGEKFEKHLAKFLIFFGSLIFMLIAIPPLFRLLSARHPEAEMVAVPSGEGRIARTPEEEEELTLAPQKMSDREKIYKLAQSNPDRAADLVRRWLREE